MSEYKRNISEAFTAVISLISLYNSVACHESAHMRAHTHSYGNTCIYIDTDVHKHAQIHANTPINVCFVKMIGE